MRALGVGITSHCSHSAAVPSLLRHRAIHETRAELTSRWYTYLKKPNSSQLERIMAAIDLTRTALVLIDIQSGLSHPTHWGKTRSNPCFEKNIINLLATFRNTQPKPLIIHIAHHSLEPNSLLHPDSGNGKNVEFMEIATPKEDGSEPIVVKHVNSGFIGTDLEERLRKARINALFIAGLTTDHCVSTTTRMAANLGVVDYPDEGVKGRVVLVGDATATHERGKWDAETVQAVQIASLNEEFAEVLSTEEVIRLIQS